MAFTTKDPDDTYLAILNLGDANEVLHATTTKAVKDGAGNVSLLELSQDTIAFTGILNADVADGLVMDAGIDIEADQVITDALLSQTDEAVGVFYVSGDPEGSLTAGIGSVALRLDGSTGTTAYVKEAGVGNTGWVAVDSIVNWIDMDDTPVAYSADKWLKVNAGGTELEFVSAPTGAETFVALTDTPADYSGDALKILRVNAGATAVEFATPFAETFLALGDTPGAFVANNMVKVNAGNTALELGDPFVTSSPAWGEIMFYGVAGWTNLSVGVVGEVLSSGGAGADPTWETTSAVFPSAVQGEIVYYSGAAWVVLPVGTADQVLTTNGAAANPSWEDVSADVIDLGDTPSDYASDGDIVYSNGTDAWQYQTIGFFLGEKLDEPYPGDGEVIMAESGGSVGYGWYMPTFDGLGDTPAAVSGNPHGVLVVNEAEDAVEFNATDPGDGTLLRFNDGNDAWEDFGDDGNGDGSMLYTAYGKWETLAPSGDEGDVLWLETADTPGWHELIFTDLGDTPDDYSGATRGLLAVNTGEDSIEFVATDPGDNQILRFDDGGGNWVAGLRMIIGSGSPESSVDGDPGDIYLRDDGSTTDVMYVKATGTGNTGWALVTSTSA